MDSAAAIVDPVPVEPLPVEPQPAPSAPGPSDPAKAVCYSWPVVNLAASETESNLQELDSIVTLLESLVGERFFEEWFKVDCRPIKEVCISSIDAGISQVDSNGSDRQKIAETP
jgi:hypothetical protein